MNRDGSTEDLAQKLAKQRANATYRRLRSIQQFSHRFRLAGILVVTLFLLLSYIFYLLSLRHTHPAYRFLAWGMLILAWGYLLALPLVFGWRLSLPAYVLRKHWMWLAVAVGLPIDVYLLPVFLYPDPTAWWTQLPLVFFAMLFWGLLRRGTRERAFRAEVSRRKATWDRLLRLGVLDLALFGFWDVAATHSDRHVGS